MWQNPRERDELCDWVPFSGPRQGYNSLTISHIGMLEYGVAAWCSPPVTVGLWQQVTSSPTWHWELKNLFPPPPLSWKWAQNRWGGLPGQVAWSSMNVLDPSTSSLACPLSGAISDKEALIISGPAPAGGLWSLERRTPSVGMLNLNFRLLTFIGAPFHWVGSGWWIDCRWLVHLSWSGHTVSETKKLLRPDVPVLPEGEGKDSYVQVAVLHTSIFCWLVV